MASSRSLSEGALHRANQLAIEKTRLLAAGKYCAQQIQHWVRCPEGLECQTHVPCKSTNCPFLHHFVKETTFRTVLCESPTIFKCPLRYKCQKAHGESELRRVGDSAGRPELRRVGDPAGRPDLPEPELVANKRICELDARVSELSQRVQTTQAQFDQLNAQYLASLKYNQSLYEYILCTNYQWPIAFSSPSPSSLEGPDSP